MVELPRGDTIETRRGGPDVLRTLVYDQFNDNGTGYIRIERIPKAGNPRIGQLIIKDGKALAAIHEQMAIIHSVEALVEIEDDALFLETQLTVIKGVDVEMISQLHPEAILQIETKWEDTTSAIEGEHWWQSRKATEIKWAIAAELPDYETVVETPEFIQRAAAIKRAKMQGDLAGELLPGRAHLLDAGKTDDAYHLAYELASIGRPLLIISRIARETVSVEFNIPIASCWWLSERPDGAEQSLGPRLEEIGRVVTDFLWGNMRAVVLFDGLEFLSSINGNDRAIGFLRHLTDEFNDSENLLLIPADLLVWPEKYRRMIQREAEPIPAKLVKYWLEDLELLAEHPFCAPPSEEEKKWIEDSLKTALETNNKYSSEIAPPVLPSPPKVNGLPEVNLETEKHLGLANTFSAGDLAKQWINEEGEEDVVATVTPENLSESDSGAPDDDWVPTFHSAASKNPINPTDPVLPSPATTDVLNAQPPHETHSSMEEGEEVELKLTEIPTTVLQTLFNHLPRGEIISAELEVEDGQIHYELSILQDGVEYEIEITPEGFLVELEVESRLGPREPVILGKRREQKFSLESTEQYEDSRKQLQAVANSAKEISTKALGSNSRLNDELSKAKQTLEAVSTASISASEKIGSADLPLSTAEIERMRKIGEWDQVANITSQKVPNIEMVTPSDLPNSWSAAAKHNRKPIITSPDLNAQEDSTLITHHPRSSNAKNRTSRENSRRNQRDMSMNAITNRIAILDEKRMKEEKGKKVQTKFRGDKK